MPQTTKNGLNLTAHSSGCCGHDHGHEHEHEDEHKHGNTDSEENFNLKKELIIVGLVSIALIAGIIWEKPLHNTPFSIGEYLIFIPAYLISGWSVLKTAGRNIIKGHIFDENFLMTIATLGALAIHKLPEAVGVMLFYQIGELCQELAVSRSRKSIKSLLEIRPDYANLKTDELIQVVDPDTVKINDLIIVKPGEKIPLDGEVIAGDSFVNTAALTGESVPRTVQVGTTVLAGMLNQTGLLTIKVTKIFGESSIAKILDLVENASSQKAKTQKFITKFAKIYTPIVVVSSLLVALLPPLFITGATQAEWIYRALILLVISCPCGLVISIPLSYFGGVGGAAKRGILVKGATYLDTLAELKIVVFDKTGTLTEGVFKVSSIVPEPGFSATELLRIATTVESYSNHPIAQSIRDAYQKQIDTAQIVDYQEISGLGISAVVNHQQVLAGNDRLLHLKNIPHHTCQVEGTVVHLAIENKYIGYIVIADELRKEAIVAINNLRKLGIQKVIMLTGDTLVVADKIANLLTLDSYQAELLPEDKLTALEQIKMRHQGNVAFVGDGINDTPVMARADVGLAMGGLGADAAIETADVVIMNDHLTKVAEAIEIGRKTKTIVWQNIILAIGIKGLFILLGIVGIATMWEAVFADVGVALLAILNATRLIGYNRKLETI